MALNVGALRAIFFDLDDTLVEASSPAPSAPIQTLLRELGARYHLAVISNGRIVTQRAKLRAAELERSFARIWISQALGVKKPHRAPFARALAAAGCAPEEALFVGDDPIADVMGASRLGLQTCWVARDRVFPTTLACVPDVVVDDVTQLPSVLGPS